MEHQYHYRINPKRMKTFTGSKQEKYSIRKGQKERMMMNEQKIKNDVMQMRAKE